MDNISIFEKYMQLLKSIRPPFLTEGDTIAIVAPARKVSAEELVPAIKVLESWGLKVKLSKNIYAIENQYAGSDELRTEDYRLCSMM